MEKDFCQQVVEKYCEGGNLRPYERCAAIVAMHESRGASPELAYRVALRFIDKMLTAAEKEAGSCR
jgi:hypothetical protein